MGPFLLHSSIRFRLLPIRTARLSKITACSALHHVNVSVDRTSGAEDWVLCWNCFAFVLCRGSVKICERHVFASALNQESQFLCLANRNDVAPLYSCADVC